MSFTSFEELVKFDLRNRNVNLDSSVWTSGEEDEDNGLNDDDMEEYDSKLAEIFKQRSLNQTQKKGNIYA